jgi:flagellar hook-associated protein 1 FlgK
MSLTGSISSALSGLAAASRTAQVVSSNIANALTEGYGRREVQLSAYVAGGTGQGVAVSGVSRHSNATLMSDRRQAEAGLGNRTAVAGYFAKLESLLGTGTDTGSLAGRIANFDSALIEASSRPDSVARLANAVTAGAALVSHIGAAAQGVQGIRMAADHEISVSVGQLNQGLQRVEELNTQIVSNSASGREVSGLMDLRQAAVDDIAKLIPLREVLRSGGQVALYALGGLALLEGKASQFSFQPTPTIVAGMTQASGALGGLSVNGRAVNTSDDAGLASGGALAANFKIRDDLAPAAQGQLDALARDLVDRFSDVSVDSTRAATDPGLFTDQQGLVQPGTETGLAQRLELNAGVDPAAGGAAWRLRDGVGAIAQGASGDASLLGRLQSILGATRIPNSPILGATPRSFATIASEITSTAATARVGLESEAMFQTAKLGGLQYQEKSEGVDSDREMQTLLQVEQAYSANVRVIQTVNQMIQTLLEL